MSEPILPPDAQVEEVAAVGRVNPGFRVTAAELSDDEAFRLMRLTCNGIIQAALARRYDLLDAGFATSHSLCEQLDNVARDFAVNLKVLRRQQYERRVKDTEPL